MSVILTIAESSKFNVTNPQSNSKELLKIYKESNSFRRKRIQRERELNLSLNESTAEYLGFFLNDFGSPVATFKLADGSHLQLYASEFQQFDCFVSDESNEIIPKGKQSPLGVKPREEVIKEILASNKSLVEKQDLVNLADELALSEKLTIGTSYKIEVTLFPNAVGEWEGKKYHKKRLLWNFVAVEQPRTQRRR